MKNRLEKINIALFENLTSYQVSNLNMFLGGEVRETKGTIKQPCGAGYNTKDFTDKQKYHWDKTGMVNDGAPYDIVVARFIMDEVDVANIAADAIIYDEM